MGSYVTNIVILIIAAVVPVCVIIRLPRLGYPIGVLVVWLLFSLRDTLWLEWEEIGEVWAVWLFSRFLVAVSYCTPVYGVRELCLVLRNRKSGIRAARGKKVLLAVVGTGVVLIVPVWWVWLGLMQCYAYNKVVSNPSWRDRLGVVPTAIELQEDQSVPSLSLGYAEVRIDPELIRSVELVFSASVLIDCSEWEVTFLIPESRTYEEFSEGLVNATNPFHLEYIWGDALHCEPPSIEDLRADPVGRLNLEMIEYPYGWNVKVVNTMPKAFREIFLMRRGEFREYMALAVAKAFGPRAEGEIRIFETDFVRGIIVFGWGGKREQMFADVFSRQSNIGQAILVRSDISEKAKEALLSIVASYRFLISDTPGKEDLREMVLAEIGKHDKFKETEEPEAEQ